MSAVIGARKKDRCAASARGKGGKDEEEERRAEEASESRTPTSTSREKGGASGPEIREARGGHACPGGRGGVKRARGGKEEAKSHCPCCISRPEANQRGRLATLEGCHAGRRQGKEREAVGESNSKTMEQSQHTESDIALPKRNWQH